MNNEQIKEIRTARGEAAINGLLATALAKRMMADTRRAAAVCDVDARALIAAGIIIALKEDKMLDYMQECMDRERSE